MKHSIKNQTSKNSMGEFKTLIRKYYGRLAGFCVLVIGAEFLGTVAAIELIGQISAMFSAGKGRETLLFIAAFLITYLLAGGLEYTFTLIRAAFIRDMAVEAEQAFLRVYGEIRYKDYFFDRAKAMGQMKTAVSGVEDAAGYICTVIATTAALIISVSYLSYLSFSAILMSAAISVLFILLLRKDNLRLPEIMRRFNHHMKILYAKQWEQIKNHKIAGFLRQSRVVEPYRRTTGDFMKDLKKIKIIGNRSSLVSDLGVDIAVICTAVLGAVLFFQEAAGIDEVLQILLCVPHVAGTLMSVPKLLNTWQISRSDIEMMDEVYERRQNQDEISKKEPPCGSVEALKVNNLTFHYHGASKNTLQNLNIDFGRGVHLLKGASGCGKSTFLRILGGELPIQEGALFLGDLEIASDVRYDISSYIDYMEQEPVVICGTAAENILMGKQMERQRFDQAVERADLEALMQRLPMGAETIVSPDTLSSGEKQKIALARIFYQDKPIWLLDEPASALDPAAMKKIMKSIAAYGKKRIIIMTSHQEQEDIPLKVHLFDVGTGQ